jgi:hypothetical protein
VLVGPTDVANAAETESLLTRARAALDSTAGAAPALPLPVNKSEEEEEEKDGDGVDDSDGDHTTEMVVDSGPAGTGPVVVSGVYGVCEGEAMDVDEHPRPSHARARGAEGAATEGSEVRASQNDEPAVAVAVNGTTEGVETQAIVDGCASAKDCPELCAMCGDCLALRVSKKDSRDEVEPDEEVNTSVWCSDCNTGFHSYCQPRSMYNGTNEALKQVRCWKCMHCESCTKTYWEVALLPHHPSLMPCASCIPLIFFRKFPPFLILFFSAFSAKSLTI